MKCRALILGLLLTAAGCAKIEPMSVFGRCAQDSDCESGLFCAQGGPLAGHCARSCTADSECNSRYGASHACSDSVCVQACGGLSECAAVETGDFESCATGLSCRVRDSEQCVSLCAAPSWGMSRTPGLSSGGGAEADGGVVDADVDGGTDADGVAGMVGGGTANEAGAMSDGSVGPSGDAASADGSAGMNSTDTDAGAGVSYTCPGLPVVTDYAALGPFDVKMFSEVGPDNKCTLFRPDATLGQGGFKHPVAAWGYAGIENTGPEDYSTFLGHVVSHGFVVIACFEPILQQETIEAGMDWLIEQNLAGPLAGKLDVTREVMFGHHWGGWKSTEAAHRANVKAAIVLHGPQPDAAAAKSMHVPLLMLATALDVRFYLDGMSPIYSDPEVVPMFGATFDDTSVKGLVLLDETEACLGELPCPGYGGEIYRGPVVAWLRLWVCGDQAARQFYYGDECVLCRAPWTMPLRTPAMLTP